MTDSKASCTTTVEVPPIVEAAEAVANTIVNPTIPVLADDLLLVHKLVTEVKAKLVGKPRTLLTLFNVLFHIDQIQ